MYVRMYICRRVHGLLGGLYTYGSTRHVHIGTYVRTYVLYESGELVDLSSVYVHYDVHTYVHMYICMYVRTCIWDTVTCSASVVQQGIG